jgi:hypothetical protein
MSDSLLPLVARKEPTVDPIARQHGLAHKRDTVLYRDEACTQVAARWPWHFSSCPRHNQKRVTLNCFQWRLIWIS